MLYFEFEDINAANKSLKEVVGFDSQSDLAKPTMNTRREKKREMELELILGSDFKGWNLSENLIAEKNLTNAPWEFGHAIGISLPRPPKSSGAEDAFLRAPVKALSKDNPYAGNEEAVLAGKMNGVSPFQFPFQ